MSDGNPQGNTDIRAAETAPKKPGGRKGGALWGWSKEILKWTVLGIAGFLLSEGLTWFKFKQLGAEDGVARLAESQKAEFESLRRSLSGISGAIPAANRGEFQQIKSSLARIEGQNQDMVRVIALAREEVSRVSQLAEAKTGVPGGYSFILTENSGMQLDADTTLGVGNISRSAVAVRLSSVGAGANKRALLNSGEGIEYRGADGSVCRASVISIGQDQAASFAVRCGGASSA